MFIVEKELTTEGKILLRIIKRKMGFVPPHFELFAALNPKRLKMYLEELEHISSHSSIDADFFVFIRFITATKESFDYCINLNTKMLKSRGYSDEQIKSVADSLENLPLDSRHKELFIATIDAMANSKSFTKEKIDKLQDIGWSHEDIWDALDHGAFLYKYSKILSAYSR